MIGWLTAARRIADVVTAAVGILGFVGDKLDKASALANDPDRLVDLVITEALEATGVKLSKRELKRARAAVLQVRLDQLRGRALAFVANMERLKRERPL